MTSECGAQGENRRRLIARVPPDPCRCMMGPKIACCPDHATYVHRPEDEGGGLLGMTCEKCGGLIAMDGQVAGRQILRGMIVTLALAVLAGWELHALFFGHG